MTRYVIVLSKQIGRTLSDIGLENTKMMQKAVEDIDKTVYVEMIEQALYSSTHKSN